MAIDLLRALHEVEEVEAEGIYNDTISAIRNLIRALPSDTCSELLTIFLPTESDAIDNVQSAQLGLVAAETRIKTARGDDELTALGELAEAKTKLRAAQRNIQDVQNLLAQMDQAISDRLALEKLLENPDALPNFGDIPEGIYETLEAYVGMAKFIAPQSFNWEGQEALTGVVTTLLEYERRYGINFDFGNAFTPPELQYEDEKCEIWLINNVEGYSSDRTMNIDTLIVELPNRFLAAYNAKDGTASELTARFKDFLDDLVETHNLEEIS